jgi:hypothetical protein
MERRKFIQIGAATSLGGLSGCIGPIENPLNNDETPETPTESSNYRDLIAETGYRPGNGVFSINMNISQLEQQYGNVLEDPFSTLPVGDNPIGLVTASSLNAVEPTIRQGLNGHPIRQDILRRFGVESGQSSLEFDEISFIGGIVAIPTAVTEDYLTSELGMQSVGSSNSSFSVYQRDNTYFAGISDNWTAIPFNSIEGQETISAVDRVLNGVGSRLTDSEYGQQLNLNNDGVITVDAWRSGVGVAVGNNANGVIGINSTANFSGGTSTTTSLLFESEPASVVVDNVSQNATNRNVSIGDRIAIIESDWE